MKYRILTILTIGFILGILWELYKLEMALFFCVSLSILMLLFWMGKRKQEKRAIRYQKWMQKQITGKMVFVVLIAFVIGVIYTGIAKKEYENVFALAQQKLPIQGIIVSNKQEEEYKDVYTLQIEKIGNSTGFKGKKLFFQVKKQKQSNKELQYGDRIYCIEAIQPPQMQRNENGFEDIVYLRSRGYIGRMQVNPKNIRVLEQDTIKGIAKIANTIKQALTNSITRLLPEETRGLCLGILLGDKEQIAKECIQDFQKSSLSHMLAVSGDHVNYLILGVSMLLYKMKCNNRLASALAILVLILFLFMTGFTPSVARACIMGILALGAKIGYQKYDWITSFSISILLLTIGNPFVLQDVGFLLSYGGVLGIVCFFPILEKETQKRKQAKQMRKSNSLTEEVSLIVIKKENNLRKFARKITENIQSIIGISLSANIVFIPIIMLTFQTISFTFWISNVLAGALMGMLVLMGFSFSILGMVVGPVLQQVLGSVLNFFLEVFMQIARFCAQIPFSRVYVVPPNLGLVIVYYVAIFLFWGYYRIKEKEPKRVMEEWFLFQVQRVKNKGKYRVKQYKKYIALLGIICFLLVTIISFIPKELTIHMVDVGQGDCTLVRTPTGKTILVDGGGSSIGSDFDVGERILLPYLLNKGIRNIDYLVFSHFDADHCMGLLPILQNLNVKQILLTKQAEKKEEYLPILQVATKKHIPIQVVEKGDTISIEKDITIEVLFPDTTFLSENAINNNSMVMRLVTKDVSMLFTGDIEEIAEKKILQAVNTTSLQADILKVAHHGSKSSSSEAFVKAVSPKIAIIGVGANNTFGHPSKEVLDRLEALHCKIYRTDQMGEITIQVKSRDNIKIHTHLLQKNV